MTGQTYLNAALTCSGTWFALSVMGPLARRLHKKTGHDLEEMRKKHLTPKALSNRKRAANPS